MDMVVQCWKENEKPSISGIAGELEQSPTIVRKLQISAGVRDEMVYYHSEVANQVLSLYQAHHGEFEKNVEWAAWGMNV